MENDHLARAEWDAVLNDWKSTHDEDDWEGFPYCHTFHGIIR